MARGSRLFMFQAMVILLLLVAACSSQPSFPGGGMTDTTSQSNLDTGTHTLDLPTDTGSHTSDTGVETATPTEQDSISGSTSTATTDTATPTEGTETVATVTESESVSQTASATTPDSDSIVYCPYLCRDNIGAETCSTLGAYWVRNAGYLCEDTAQICCQALGQPGGVQTECSSQPALTCRNTCGGSMIQHTDYYCNDATKVCCEDPAGPTCTEMAGKCVTFLENCPAGYSPSNLECGSFIEKCCAPPICPWTCTAYDGDKTCSDNISNPTAIRNNNYSCPVKGDICCQPMNAEDGITEPCANQERMVCRDTCETYEKANDDYYCKLASRTCCEDVRPKCIEKLGGQCVLPLLGCPDGMEKSTRGVCLGSETLDCCVDASPLNQCAAQGGTCVTVGSMCPLLTTMDLGTWCGNLTDICCKPIF